MSRKVIFSLMSIIIILSMLPVNGSVMASQNPSQIKPGVGDESQLLTTVADDTFSGDRSTGGPDDFGYIFNSDVTYNWIDAKSLGQKLDLIGGDDFTQLPIDIGFNFPFYENHYSQIYVTTKGLVDFYGPDVWPSPPPVLSTSEPNNYIAPFWADLGVYNNGTRPEAGIYVYQGGVAPEQFLVIEWHQVDLYYEDQSGNEMANLTFQVILYENGDILMQYEQMDFSYFDDSYLVGIENATGTDGLLSRRFSIAQSAIKYSYPVPSYRGLISSDEIGGFVAKGETADRVFDLTNNGDFGTDSYTLSYESDWPFALFEDDGVTPVTGLVSLDQGHSTSFIGRLTVPEDAVVGDYDVVSITATSDNNPSSTMTYQFTYTIPAPFAQTFYDLSIHAGGAILVRPDGQDFIGIEDEKYHGSEAIFELPNRNQLILSNEVTGNGEINQTSIVYWIIDRFGDVVQPLTYLTNPSSELSSVADLGSVVDINASGDIAITWFRYKSKYVNGFSLYNSNIFYKVLNQDGSVKIPETNLTNDVEWHEETGGMQFAGDRINPDIAISQNGNVTIAWRKITNLGYPLVYLADINFAVFDEAGNILQNVTKLTDSAVFGDTAEYYEDLTLDVTDDDKVFLTWRSVEKMVIGDYSSRVTGAALEAFVYSNSGVLEQTIPAMDNFSAMYPDVVQLSNGRMLYVAGGNDHLSVVVFENGSYLPVGAPNKILLPEDFIGESYVSITNDDNGNGIISWFTYYVNDECLNYILVDGNGEPITDPVHFYLNGDQSVSYGNVRSGGGDQGITSYHYSYPPEFTSAPVENVIAESLYSYPISATDPDLPDETLAITAPTLPDWLDFTDYGDGTALLSGTPSSLDVGDHSVELEVEDSFGLTETQSFTISVQALEAPAFISVDNALFTEGIAGTFTIETSGVPIPSIGLSGSLPTGVSFLDNGDGTATLSGTSAIGTGGADYEVVLSATNGIEPDANQNFTLIVGTPPEFDSGDTAAGMATVGEYVELSETVSGYPENSVITISGDLPTGMAFIDQGMGTAVIRGTPGANTGGIYSLTLTADNGTEVNDTLDYTLTVKTVETIGASGGTISSNAGAISIEVPAGSLTEELSFEFIPLVEPTEGVPSTLTFAGTGFQLVARDGSDVVHPTFDPPLVVEIHYDESDLGDLPEDELILYYWDTDTSTWLDAAETCISGAGYTYYTESDYFTVEICHLTEFAVMGEGGVNIFLPLIFR